jgi:hypothetical protein
MRLLDVDSGVVRFAGLLQVVGHSGCLSVAGEAPPTAFHLRGAAAFGFRATGVPRSDETLKAVTFLGEPPAAWR